MGEEPKLFCFGPRVTKNAFQSTSKLLEPHRLLKNDKYFDMSILPEAIDLDYQSIQKDYEKQIEQEKQKPIIGHKAEYSIWIPNEVPPSSDSINKLLFFFLIKKKLANVAIQNNQEQTYYDQIPFPDESQYYHDIDMSYSNNMVQNNNFDQKMPSQNINDFDSNNTQLNKYLVYTSGILELEGSDYTEAEIKYRDKDAAYKRADDLNIAMKEKANALKKEFIRNEDETFEDTVSSNVSSLSELFSDVSSENNALGDERPMTKRKKGRPRKGEIILPRNAVNNVPKRKKGRPPK